MASPVEEPAQQAEAALPAPADVCGDEGGAPEAKRVKLSDSDEKSQAPTEQEPAWVTGAIVYALNKPRMMVTTNVVNPNTQVEHRRGCMGAWLREVMAEIDGRRVFHVGRLDKKTTGLIFATDTGYFERFINTPGMLYKEYIVTTERPCTQEMLDTLVKGVELTDGPARALEAELLSHSVEKREVTQGHVRKNKKKMSRSERKQLGPQAAEPDDADKVFVDKVTCVARLVINIGRNHIVKKMFDHLGLSVTKLHRSAVGPVSLDTLRLPKDGQHVRLTVEQLRTLWEARTQGTQLLDSDEEYEGDE